MHQLTATEVRTQLLSLGTLLARRRVPRSAEALLVELPGLLRLLRRHRQALMRTGLRRAERVAALQLLTALCDAWQAGDVPACLPLQAALEVFCLRTVPYLQRAFPGQGAELMALCGLRVFMPTAAPRPTPSPPGPAARPGCRLARS